MGGDLRLARVGTRLGLEVPLIPLVCW